MVSDMFGNDLRFNQPFPKVKGVLAAAPQAWERLLQTLQTVGASDRMAEFHDGSKGGGTPPPGAKEKPVG